jgi:VWFA-related protein
MTKLVGLGLTAALAVALAESAPRAQAADTPRVIYFTALDRQGEPVLDLAASDLAVKEGGRVRDIVRLEPATERLHISLIVDDNGTGLFRSTVAQFVQRLQNDAEFAITVVNGQAMRVVDFTADARKLTDGINFLGARPATPDGGQLLSAVYEAARDFRRREVARPVIVALTVGGEEHTPLPAHHVLEQLRDSRASLNVFEMTNSLLRSTVAISRASQLLEESLNLNEVLGDGSKQSGGRRDEIVAATGILRGVQRLAEELARQYKLTYVLPNGVKPNERLELTATRSGVVVRAPRRIPSK